jgi:hypothetical protein
MKNDVNLLGICIYPVLDRPDWDTMTYIPCGIWGYHEKTGERFEEKAYLATVKACMQQMNSFLQNRKEVVVYPPTLIQEVA